MLCFDLLPLSLCDYPKHLASVIYMDGCSKGCKYCFNPALQVKHNVGYVTDKEVLNELERRIQRGLIKSVVITGGEPLEQNINELTGFISALKSYGYRIKINTNGLHPEELQLLLKESLIDYVALDFDNKNPYLRVCLAMLRAYKETVDYELRRTVYQERDTVVRLAEMCWEYLQVDEKIRFNRYIYTQTQVNHFTPFTERDEERVISALSKLGFTDKHFE